MDPEQLEDDPLASDTGEEPQASASDDPLADDKQLQDAFYHLYLECCGEDRYPRLTEVKDVKQAENYWAGRQYDWWSNKDQRWKPTAQAASYGDLNIEDMPRFEFVTNIFQSKGLTVIGAVAGAPPRIRFFPEDADEDNDLRTAEGRTKLTKLIERWNPPQKLLQTETYHAWTGGFIAWWSRYVANGEKYGIDSVHTLAQGSVDTESTLSCPACGWSAPAEEAEPPVPCPQCGDLLTEENIEQGEPIPVPEDGGDEDIAKGRQVINVFGALNCKRPQHANEQSEWHYFAIEREIHYSTIRAAHPARADEIKAGLNFGSDDAFERNARLSVAENTTSPTQTAAAQANLNTYAVIWFRPTAFWMMKDKALRERALELFPRGIRIELSGSTYCTSEAESMDDAIVSCHAMPGRGQHRPAIGSAMISIQDRLNTLANISMETYEYGIPITYRDSTTFAADADDDQLAAPGQEVEVVIEPNGRIGDKILQVRADSVSPDMHTHMMDLFGPVPDAIAGTYPALTGSAQQGEQPNTLGQQSMQRDQAMGRMGVFYVNLKQAHADLMTISCRSFEAHAEGIVKIPTFGASGDFESESVDVTALEGEAEAYPEGEENFPELWNQQRATMMQIMDTPFGQELAKVPGNAELFGKMTGIRDLKIPGIDAWRKQLKEIGELAKIPEGDDLLAGIAPMVEVDPEMDEHPIEAACCKWWCNNDIGQKIKRENPMGWLAVKQHGIEHQSLIPKAPPPQKPLSETFTTNFKDLPPEAQAQALEQMGIHVSLQDFIAKAMLDKASKPTPKPPIPPNGAHEETHAHA